MNLKKVAALVYKEIEKCDLVSELDTRLSCKSKLFREVTEGFGSTASVHKMLLYAEEKYKRAAFPKDVALWEQRTVDLRKELISREQKMMEDIEKALELK